MSEGGSGCSGLCFFLEVICFVGWSDRLSSFELEELAVGRARAPALKRRQDNKDTEKRIWLDE